MYITNNLLGMYMISNTYALEILQHVPYIVSLKAASKFNKQSDFTCKSIIHK